MRGATLRNENSGVFLLLRYLLKALPVPALLHILRVRWSYRLCSSAVGAVFCSLSPPPPLTSLTPFSLAALPSILFHILFLPTHPVFSAEWGAQGISNSSGVREPRASQAHREHEVPGPHWLPVSHSSGASLRPPSSFHSLPLSWECETPEWGFAFRTQTPGRGDSTQWQSQWGLEGAREAGSRSAPSSADFTGIWLHA